MTAPRADVDLQDWVRRQEKRVWVRRWMTIAVALLGILWVGLSFVARQQVEVQRVGQVVCSDGDRPAASAAEPVEITGSTCRVRVRVSNHALVPVHETQLRLPYLGPQGGPRVRLLDVVAGGESLGQGVNPQITLRDALFLRDVTIAPGGHDDLTLVLGPQPDGCFSRRDMPVTGLPTASLSVLGFPGTRAPSTPFVLARTTVFVDGCPRA